MLTPPILLETGRGSPDRGNDPCIQSGEFQEGYVLKPKCVRLHYQQLDVKISLGNYQRWQVAYHAGLG